MSTSQKQQAIWTAEDYEGVAAFSGAKKLADSAVAPLVAQARGCETVADPETAKNVADRAYTANKAPVTRRLRAMVSGGNDFLVIPWRRFDSVLARDLRPGSIQVRPSTPLPVTKAGEKERKYETLAGHPSIIDMNPGVTETWFTSASMFILTEGALKGDSALTAQLLAAGVTRDELAPVSGGEEEAAAALAKLLDRIDPADRTVIFSLIGVGNWHKNDEWRAVNLEGKRVYIAFDGDLRSNRQVWGQADKLFDWIERKKGIPGLIDLGGADAAQFRESAGFDKTAKLGVDDFLSHIGTWSDLGHLKASTLPPQPEGKDVGRARIGDVMVSDDGLRVVTFAKENDFSEPDWSTVVVNIGGRIKRVSSRKMPAGADLRDGEITDGSVIGGDDGDVVLELKWEDAEGNVITREITGPLAFLDATPADWARRGAKIHADIRRHPDWPPRYKAADQWVQAIKAHRADEQEVHEGWNTMGWVPSENLEEDASQPAHPVFIVGQSTLGKNAAYEQHNKPGVTESDLQGANHFGVNDTYRDFESRDDLDGYKRQVAQDVREITNAFIRESPWETENPTAVGSLILGSALRPTCPAPPAVVMFLTGGPGSGKTWTASFQQAFWQPRPGVWTERNLPGSASDTFVAIEHSISKTPIWVIDDLAPQTSRNEAERQETVIDSIIRATFNGSAKRRGTIDGTQRSVNSPRALPVFTAENSRDTLSIRQRCIEIRFEAGRTNDERARKIQKLARRADNPLARLTAAMIRFWINVDIESTPLPFLHDRVDSDDLDLTTWRGKRELSDRIISAIKTDLQEELAEQKGIEAGASARRAAMFAELLFALDVLRSLGRWAGLPADDPAIVALSGSYADLESTQGTIVQYAAADLADLRSASNAQNLMSAIKALLVGGEAHLENPAASGQPPFPNGEERSDAGNRAAGWTRDSRGGEWVPRGKPIGWLGIPAGSGVKAEWIAHLNAKNAFSLAKRHHPDLIPAGQRSGDTWRQVWTEADDDGRPYVAGYAPPSATARGVQTKAKFAPIGTRNAPEKRPGGVPVRMVMLIDAGTRLPDAAKVQRDAE